MEKNGRVFAHVRSRSAMEVAIVPNPEVTRRVDSCKPRAASDSVMQPTHTEASMSCGRMPTALPRFLFNMQDLLLPFGAARSFSLEVVGTQVADSWCPLLHPLVTMSAIRPNSS